MHNVYSGLFIRSFSIRFYIFHLFVTFFTRVFIFFFKEGIFFLYLLLSILQSCLHDSYFCISVMIFHAMSLERNEIRLFSIRETLAASS